VALVILLNRIIIHLANDAKVGVRIKHSLNFESFKAYKNDVKRFNERCVRCSFDLIRCAGMAVAISISVIAPQLVKEHLLSVKAFLDARRMIISLSWRLRLERAHDLLETLPQQVDHEVME
jgi:hypothetical protein